MGMMMRFNDLSTCAIFKMVPVRAQSLLSSHKQMLQCTASDTCVGCIGPDNPCKRYCIKPAKCQPPPLGQTTTPQKNLALPAPITKNRPSSEVPQKNRKFRSPKKKRHLPISGSFHFWPWPRCVSPELGSPAVASAPAACAASPGAKPAARPPGPPARGPAGPVRFRVAVGNPQVGYSW